MTNPHGANRVTSRQFLTAGAFVALVSIAGVVAMGQGRPGAAQIKNPVAPTAESVAAGKQIYLRRCASCHAASGEGGPGNDLIPAAPSLVDDQWDHGSTDGEIFDNIKNGVAPDFNMVPFKDTLKDEEIWNVVNDLRSIAQKK
jgi:mono/diheme cytochrome c family protein